MAIHVAILLRPYLQLILQGKKTVESRLTQRPLVPFQAIAPGERIFFKESGGAFAATAIAGDVRFHDDLSPAKIRTLQRQYNTRVCGNNEYWHAKRFSRHATFVTLQDVEPLHVGPQMAPSSGLAWFVLDETQSPLTEVSLTGGALRNHYLRASGTNITPGPITLRLPGGRVVSTELLPSGLIRWRGWGPYYVQQKLSQGDRVRLLRIAERQYQVSMHASKPQRLCKT